jgi:hypothetical protein
MNIIRFSILLAVLILIIGCGSSEKITRKYKLVKGEFTYSLTDSSGTQLAGGNMKIDYLKERDFSGSYTAVKDSTVKFDGQETFNGGAFTGYYNDSLSLAWFNMNPKVADANIFISAIDYTDSLKGGWYYSTFRGKKSGGLFLAKRVK